MSGNRMGLRTGSDTLYECDKCHDTVCCSASELTSQWKWKTHSGAGWSLLLCDECEPKK